MKQANDKRKNRRYDISEYIKEDYYKDIHIEINADKTYYPALIDISMNGLGFEIEENESAELDEFDRIHDFYMNIYFVDKPILAEVRKIWSVKVEEKGRYFLKGGVVFTVISPENRLLLADYINKLRN